LETYISPAEKANAACSLAEYQRKAFAAYLKQEETNRQSEHPKDHCHRKQAGG